jgi:hypothetical protein
LSHSFSRPALTKLDQNAICASKLIVELGRGTFS